MRRYGHAGGLVAHEAGDVASPKQGLSLVGYPDGHVLQQRKSGGMEVSVSSQKSCFVPLHSWHWMLPASPAWQRLYSGQKMSSSFFLSPQRAFSASVPAQRAQSAFGPDGLPLAAGFGPRVMQPPQ